MNISDPIADMLIRIKNAQAVGKADVSMPFSSMKFAVAKILHDTGFVSGIERTKKKIKATEHEYLTLTLKYSDGQPALTGAKMISRQSRRMYIKAKELRPVHSGYGLAIISTPQGIMDSNRARKEKLGGEIICEIW